MTDLKFVRLGMLGGILAATAASCSIPIGLPETRWEFGDLLKLIAVEGFCFGGLYSLFCFHMILIPLAVIVFPKTDFIIQRGCLLLMIPVMLGAISGSLGNVLAVLLVKDDVTLEGYIITAMMLHVGISYLFASTIYRVYQFLGKKRWITTC